MVKYQSPESLNIMEDGFAWEFFQNNYKEQIEEYQKLNKKKEVNKELYKKSYYKFQKDIKKRFEFNGMVSLPQQMGHVLLIGSKVKKKIYKKENGKKTNEVKLFYNTDFYAYRFMYVSANETIPFGSVYEFEISKRFRQNLQVDINKGNCSRFKKIHHLKELHKLSKLKFIY